MVPILLFIQVYDLKTTRIDMTYYIENELFTLKNVIINN